MIISGMFSYLNQKCYTLDIRAGVFVPCLTDVRMLRKIAEPGSEEVT
jgi:hypothetical protein